MVATPLGAGVLFDFCSESKVRNQQISPILEAKA
jgi:hypothetical protein